MRKKMSICELKRYYEGRSPKRILFCTENQALDMVENPIKASLAFTSMLMSCTPNVICLKNGDSTLYFERVKCIHVDADGSPLGAVLNVVCGDSTGRDNDRQYTLIAS